MSAPSGYTALDFVGFTDKGTYSPIVKYMRNDLVHHGGNIMRCKVDDTLNVTPVEGANWELWIGASANLAERTIAPLENNPADVAFGVGRQIIYDDWLWEVIAPIEVGDALIDYDVDPTNANIKKSAPVETQLLAVKAEADATDNMIAPTEASASSSSAPYSVGDQLILNNILYDVIAAIQIGDALTTGTGGNIAAADTLTDQLAAKANSSDLATIAKGGDIIVITASYGMTPSSSDNFLVYLEAMLDNIYDHIYTSAVSGNSFSNDGYLAQLQTLAASIDNKEFVRDIVVVGHGNDADLQSSDLVDKMSVFRSYARTTFPNAKISLAPVSVRSTAQGAFNRYSTYKEMLSTISYHMITIMTDLNHILALDYPTYLGSDGWHPSNAGARLIAEGIYNVLVNGEFNMITKRTDPSTDKNIGSYMNVDSSTFLDTVTTDIHEMAVCLDFKFTAITALTISTTPMGTRLMSCNPMIKGLTGDTSAQVRTMSGIMSDDTAGTYIPIKIAIHPHSGERPNEYWYYISSNTGANYTLTLGHNYSIRVYDRTPFLYN